MTLFRSWWRELGDVFRKATGRERPYFDDGTPRKQITEDGCARLTLIRGLNPGKQRVIRAENEK